MKKLKNYHSDDNFTYYIKLLNQIETQRRSQERDTEHEENAKDDAMKTKNK